MHKMTRRSMMLAAAAAAGATWFDIPRLIAAELTDKQQASLRKYGGFPMGIQSYSLRGFGAEGAIERIAELDLHWVEFFSGHYQPTADEGAIDSMRQQLARHEISISAHGVHGFGADHEQNEALFNFAKLSGIRTLTADPAPESFESLDALVKKYDIRIAIHNHGPGHRYDKIEDCIEAAEPWDKRIGYCADLGHFIRSAEDPTDAIYKLGDRLYGIHLKDFEEMRGDSPGAILGEGVMDVVAVFRALKEVEFPADGALSLEYEENPQDPMEDIRGCLTNAAEAAQQVANA